MCRAAQGQLRDGDVAVVQARPIGKRQEDVMSEARVCCKVAACLMCTCCKSRKLSAATGCSSGHMAGTQVHSSHLPLCCCTC